MGGFSEVSTVQAAVVDRLCSLGWDCLAGRDLGRTVDGVFVESELGDALVRLNPQIAAKPERVDEVLPRLRAAALASVNDGVVAANERMTTWLRGHQTMKYVGED